MNITVQKLATFAVVAAFAVTTALFAATAPKAQPGDQARWALDFRVRLEQHSSQPAEVHLTGEWISTVTAVRAGQHDAQLQIVNTRLIGEPMKKAPASSIEDLRKRLSRPFWATYRDDGGLIGIHFFRDVNPSDRNLLQMIATELQLVRPVSARPSWTAQERDAAGEYLAFYATAQSDRILKRKVKYIYTDGVAGIEANGLRVNIDKSEATFSLGPRGDVQAIDAISRMSMELSPDPASQLAVVAEIHASHGETSRAPELIGSLGRNAALVDDSAIVTHKGDPEELRFQADERLLEGHSTESILAEAFAKTSDDVALGERLNALFRQRPAAIASAVALLRKHGPERKVTNALGRNGTPESLSALATLAHDASVPEALRVDAITAFVQVKQPTVETMQMPASLINDTNEAVRSAARMMSGAMARAGRPQHPKEADSIDKALIALYRETKDNAEAVELLGSLGNSVGPSAIEVIEGALKDPRVPVRAAAARALRLAAGPDIDARIASVITSDKDPTVRSDGIFAARFRQPLSERIADALLSAATSDGVDYVRSNAVSLIRQNPTASMAIPEALEKIAATDASAGIRRQASEALAELSHAPSKAR